MGKPLKHQDTILTKQRELTTEERKQQSERFLTYQTKKSFKTITLLSEFYKVERELGNGAFGCVKLASHKVSGTPCAIKIITKKSLNVEVYKELNKNELQILEETNHPHITRVFELMEDSRNYYIVMELISGGNLFDAIKKKRNFTQQEMARIIQQLCLALNYMHGLGIMHRDLKPENLMCERNEEQGIVIKLTDFGFATHFDLNNPQTLSLGSPLYMAPELTTSSPYDNKVDVWAVGVILYVMVSGMYPFAGRTKEDIYLAVQTREPNYPRIQNAGEELTNVIKACLTKNPADRPTINQLL